MVSRYLLEDGSDEEATRESPEGSINEEATRESSEGCSTEEATLEFNEDSKSREEKPNLFQHDNKSNEEEIQNSGEVTSSEETHPEHPPQSARISNRRESRSRLENIAGPSNRRDTVDSVTGSSDQEEIKVPNTPESIINGHAHTNGNSDDCKDSVSLFSNQLHSKLEDLKSTSTNENSRDSHAGPSTRNDNQDSSEDLLCDESISSFSQATSNDSLEKSDQESLLEQPLHTKRRNDIINAAEDDNAVQRSWNERASRERDDNRDRPETLQVVEAPLLIKYDSHPATKIESFPNNDDPNLRNFVNFTRHVGKSNNYDIISILVNPEHAPTSKILTFDNIEHYSSSHDNVSDPSDQNDSDFIDNQESNSEMINVAQDDSTSQESWNEAAATRERDTDSDRPANLEVPETPESSVTPESPVTPGTPKTPDTPINPNIVSGSSDFSDSDFIDFQESNSKMINVAQDDSTSEENWDETATTRKRDNDNSDHQRENLKDNESFVPRAQLSLIRKRKIGDNSGLRSEPDNVTGPSGHGDYDNINFQKSSNAMINAAQEDDDVGEENIDERATIRESDTDDNSNRLSTSESSDSPYPLSPRKRRTLDNSRLHFTPGNVPGPSDSSDHDYINFQQSSDEMIDVGQENMDERAIMTKRDTDDSDRPGTSEDLQSDV